jgi:hypothetical protein
MTSSYFGTLVPSTAEADAPVHRLCLGERLAEKVEPLSLDFLCQHPLDRVVRTFAGGARVHYSKDLPLLSVGACKDTDGGRHWRLGRMELEVFKKQTPEARVTRALEVAGNRWGWGDAWEEMVALGIKDPIGAPARQLIHQGRWRDLDAWVVQRRAQTAHRRGA